MNILKQVQLNKSRSYANCISAAVAMFFDNIKAIFHHVWAYALVYAILLSAHSVLSSSSEATPQGQTPTVVATLCAMAFCLLCADVAYCSRITAMLNGQKMRWNIVRNIRITLVLIASLLAWAAVCLAVALCFGGKAEATPYYIIGMGVFTLIYVCLLMPFSYILMKYLIEPDCKLRRDFAKSYVVGLRHLSFIFVTMLLTILCAVICGTLMSMPTVIVLAANAVSAMGVQQFGDPSGLPSWFPFLQFGVTTLSAFIVMFINVFVAFVVYFMYGSIEKRVEEKSEYLKTKE